MGIVGQSMLVALFMTFLKSFIFPIMFSASGAAIKLIFDSFTNTFNFKENSNWFVSLLGADLLNIVVKIMISAGVVLSVFILAYNIFKLFFSGISRKTDSPIALCIRSIMSIFLCYWVVDIIYKIFFPAMQWLLDKIKGIQIGATNFEGILQNMSDMISGLSADSSTDEIIVFIKKAITMLNIGAEGFVFIIIFIIFLIFLIKTVISMIHLVTEMAERYLLVNVLTVCSPLVMPTMISNGTMNVFVSFVQMLVANSLVLAFNTLGMIMLQMGFAMIGERMANPSTSFTNIIVMMIMYSALLKVVQKFDVYLSQLAFKIQAIGGDNKGMTPLLLMGAMGKANKFMGNATKNGGLLNQLKFNAGNVLGTFVGNDNATVSKLQAPAIFHQGLGTAAGKNAKDVVSGTNLGGAVANVALDHADATKGAEVQNKFNDYKAAVIPGTVDSQGHLDAEKLRAQNEAKQTPEYQDAYNEKQMVENNLKAQSLKDEGVRDSRMELDSAKNDFAAAELQNPEYADSAIKLDTAKNDFAAEEINDDGFSDSLTHLHAQQNIQRAKEVSTPEYVDSSIDLKAAETGYRAAEQTNPRVINADRGLEVANSYHDMQVGDSTAVQTARQARAEHREEQDIRIKENIQRKKNNTHNPDGTPKNE